MQAGNKAPTPWHFPAFKPAWWLRNCHLQTILAKYLAPNTKLQLQPELLSLPDGDELMLHWGQNRPTAERPLIILLHGLEGNYRSHYIRGMMASLQQQGFATVLMHFRGCHGQPNKKPRAYHSGDTADLHFFITQLQQRLPDVALGAVGFSLGGNVLLKYCAEQGGNCALLSAVAISAPLQLAASADRINQGFSRIYQRYLLGRLKKTMRAKLKLHQPFPLPITTNHIASVQSIRQFDDLLTAPLHGFSNADDYYQQASAKPRLRQIVIPALLIHALDDPFLAAEVVPSPDELNSGSLLLCSPAGGHVGFISGGSPWRPHYWLNEIVPHFFCTQFQR